MFECLSSGSEPETLNNTEEPKQSEIFMNANVDILLRQYTRPLRLDEAKKKKQNSVLSHLLILTLRLFSSMSHTNSRLFSLSLSTKNLSQKNIFTDVCVCVCSFTHGPDVWI